MANLQHMFYYLGNEQNQCVWNTVRQSYKSVHWLILTSHLAQVYLFLGNRLGIVWYQLFQELLLACHLINVIARIVSQASAFDLSTQKAYGKWSRIKLLTQKRSNSKQRIRQHLSKISLVYNSSLPL